MGKPAQSTQVVHKKYLSCRPLTEPIDVTAVNKEPMHTPY